MVDSQNKKRKPIPASLSEYAEWRSPHIEGHAGIVMTVEGILPDATIDALL